MKASKKTGWFFLLLSLAMIFLVIDTSLRNNLLDSLPYLIQDPWFGTTIVDFYFNVAIIAAWMFYKEEKWCKRFIWLISFILLGSITTCFYVAFQFWKNRDDLKWGRILLRKEDCYG